MKSAAQEKHPRIRGESYFDKLLERSDIGNIPAYAGKAGLARRGLSSREKHPRIRGESPARASGCPMSRSSRSRSWRKPRTCIGVSPETGNIPAYAGKAPEIMEGALIFRKHPRIRGESPLTPVILYLFTETSPHTRGKRNHRVPKGPPQRNIPAYAGKAYQTRQWQKGSEKHPRIRGESLITHTLPLKVSETSPHTRGKPGGSGAAGNAPGNIPAYAGKASLVRRGKRHD